MWKHIVQRDRPQMTIQSGACALRVGYLRLRTVTISNSQYFSMPTVVTQTHLNVQCLSVLFILSEMLFCTTNTGADKSLARPGRKQTRKHVRDARDFNNIETRAGIKFFFSARQGAEGNSRHTERNVSLYPSWSG